VFRWCRGPLKSPDVLVFRTSKKQAMIFSCITRRCTWGCSRVPRERLCRIAAPRPLALALGSGAGMVGLGLLHVQTSDGLGGEKSETQGALRKAHAGRFKNTAPLRCEQACEGRDKGSERHVLA
jgi:hypothetical protein